MGNYVNMPRSEYIEALKAEWELTDQLHTDMGTAIKEAEAKRATVLSHLHDVWNECHEQRALLELSSTRADVPATTWALRPGMLTLTNQVKKKKAKKAKATKSKA